MKPALRNFEWHRSDQVKYFINEEAVYPNPPTNIIPIEPSTLKFDGAPNILTLHTGYLLLPNLLTIFQVIEAVVDQGTWNQLKENTPMSNLQAAGDEIEPLEITLSLLCPVRLTRIGILLKSFECKHLNCFDVKSFDLLTKKGHVFQCPHCNQSKSTSTLIELPIMREILNNTEATVQVIIDPKTLKWRAGPPSPEDFDDEHKSKMPQVA